LYCFISFSSFMSLFTFHATVLSTNKTQTSMPPVGYFFFIFLPVRGFFPFDPFLYCLNPFVLHVTLRSILLSLQQTQHKHPCPGRIRTHDPSKRAAEDPRLRPHCHWDRHGIEPGPPWWEAGD
jgi:hypothetical protein